MSDPKRIAYRYKGPARYPGIPANDLTEERVAMLSLKLQRALDQDGSPYQKVDAAKAAETVKKSDRKEANP